MGLYFPPLPFSFMANSKPSFVDGSDGDLVVLNGQTYQLTAGNIYSFNSIDVQAGGTIEITGTEAITQIGCKGNFICNGTIRGATIESVANRVLGADNWLGQGYSYSRSQSAGGHGGSAAYENRAGQAQVNGYGGGGNGYNGVPDGFNNPSNACPPVDHLGGTGLSNGFSTNVFSNEGPCSVSAYTSNGGIGGLGGHGQPCSVSVVTTSEQVAMESAYGGNGGGGGGGCGSISLFKGNFSGGNGGAGGGGRGEHGRGVYILAEKGIQGTGTINMSGNAGYNGGGPPAPTQGSSGGGGGGGAGGSGGAVWIRYSGAVTPTVIANAGAGGTDSPHASPGVYGYYYYNIPSYDSQNGFAGAGGLVDIQLI